MPSSKNDLARCVSTGTRIVDDPTGLLMYSYDQGEVPPGLRRLLLPAPAPDLAVQPASIEDVQAILRFASQNNVAVIPRGAATFGMGGAVPHRGGIVLDLSPRREIYGLDAKNQTIRVGAGCRWADVAAYLSPEGFDLCAYPTSWFSTVGGWVATGGLGIGCTQFGSFHQLIRKLTVVTPDSNIRQLEPADPDFSFFLGTEGQMGVVWDITFAVRPKPARQMPVLLLFETSAQALHHAEELLNKFRPYHLKYVSERRVHEINHLIAEDQSAKKHHLSERETLLACFEEAEEINRFRSWAESNALQIVSDYRAHLLWRERMFPLRVKRIAPGLLASELILPINKVAVYVEKTTELSKQFHVDIATECYFLNNGTALTLPVYTFRSNGLIDEALKASLAFVLTQTGVRMGGRPYGIGIWNSPFAQKKFGERFQELRDYKNRIDGKHLFNPGKFFELKLGAGAATRIAAVPLRAPLIPLWTRLNPLLARFLTRRVTACVRSSDPILENEALCSKCGSCIPVCPAYIETEDERTTARGKLQIARQLMQGNVIRPDEANILFLCMHCAACTDVCQSRLDLVPVWDELERRVELKYGKDISAVKQFVEAVERKKIMGVPYANGAKVFAGSQS